MTDTQYHLDVYHKVTGLPVFAIDYNGEVTEQAGNVPPFCKLFQSLTCENCHCHQTHLHAGREAEKLGEPYIYFCPCGLVHWTSPVFLNNNLCGMLVSGMVQMTIIDNHAIKRLFNVYDLPSEYHEDLSHYFNTIQMVQPEQARYLAELLHIMARNISGDQSRILDERKRFYQEQRVLGEHVHLLKDQEQKKHTQTNYPVEVERELIKKVKLGDNINAKALMNDILGYIFFEYAGNIKMLTARSLELLVVISRAAIEGGADPVKIFELTQTYTQEIPKVNDVNALSFLLIDVLEKFTDTVFPVEHTENTTVIKTALSYINQHYHEHLTLEHVANQVFLSPTYFSRLFKSETGMNFSAYINYVRVEQSKRYLLNLQYSLSDIATMVGFSDQSYFTKIFKRLEGISPGQYRRNQP